MERNEYRDMVSKLHTSIHEEDILMQGKHTGKPRAAGLLLAAVLMIALAAGVAAACRGSLQELVLRGSQDLQAAVPAGTPQSQSYDPFADGWEMISLQGYADSPEHQAALAWAEFQHGYDREGEELNAVGNDPTPWDETYGRNGYPVYTREMADKIDEIAAQHGLALHSGGLHPATLQELEDRFGDFLSADRYGGYYYADGTFQCDCEQNGIGFQIRRCMKGVLDTATLNITDAELYAQWEYETACGETVLLALGPDTALIIAERDDCFVTVNVMAGTGTAPRMTAEELQSLGDSIDFSVL